MKKFRINRVGRINALSLLAVSILFISQVKAQNCTVNAGVPRSFCDTETVLLRGTAAGLIEEGTINWEQVGGPTAIISLPEALEGEVVGTSPNTSMTFRLSATCADGSFVYQDVTHTVLPITKADAGPDQQVCPGIHNLAANPLGANETGMWCIKSNNNSISIDDPTNPNSSFTATEGMSGSNTLVWTIVGANKCVSTDEVVITNMGGSSPVNAGPDQILSNCYSTTQRTNLAASNGGNGVSGQIGTWTIVSGPNVPTIANVNNNNSSISNLIEGTYVLQWDVIGPCASGSDRMIITVPPPTVDVTGAGDNQSLTFCDGRTEVVLRAPAPQFINETVQWVQTSGPATIISNAGNHIATASGLDGTSNYSFTYTIRNTETDCENVANVTISFAQQLTLELPEKIIRLFCGETSADVNFNHTGDGAVSWRIISGPETSIHTTIPTDFVRSNGNPQRIVGLTESGTYIVQFRKLAATGSQCETLFEEVKIIVSEEPDGVSIGTDQLLGCNITSTELTGNVPDQGYGTWSQVSGPNAANIVDKNDNSTSINGLINGTYVFRWIISGGSACDANQVDTRVIVADTEPTQADAGPHQNDVCIETPIYLDANQPVLNETGLWSITPQNSGEAFVDPTNPKTMINGLVANETYTLTWTISNACGSISENMTITTSDVIGPIASNAGDDICLDTGTTVFELNGTLETPGDRTWSMVSGPNSPTIVNPNQSITAVTGAIDGTYLFELRIDNNSCTSTVDTVQVTISPETSDAVAGANQFICGDNVQLSATLPEIGTGKWVQIAGAGGLNIEDLNDPNTEVTGLVSGVYKFVWEVSNNACETKRDTVVIDVSEPGLTAVVGPELSLCGETSTTLEANSVANGLWSLVSGPNTPNFGDIASPTTTVSGLIMGEYTLRWSSYGGANCDASTADIKITVVPAADAGSDQEYCDETTSVDLVGNENSTGTWTQLTDFPMTLTSTSSNSATASGLVAGNVYIFEYTIAIDGCTSSDQVSINLVTPPIDAEAGSDQVWCDASSFSLTGNDPTDDYTGEWIVLSSPGGGTFDNINSPNAVFTPSPGAEYGVFLFSWKISNGECGNEDQVRVSNYQPPSIAEAGDAQDVVCDSQVSMLAGNPTVGVGEWTLTSKTGDAPDPTIVSPILYNSLITDLGPQSNGDPADYVFTWTVTNGPVCDPKVDNVTITVYEIPTEADAGADDELCNATEYTLSANAPGTGTGEWTNIPSGVTFSDVNSNMATVSGLTPGETYTFTWETSTQFCTSTDEVVLTNHAEPSVPEAMAEIDICQYGDLTLTNIVPTVGTGLWTQVSGLPTILLNPNQPSTKVAGIVDGETYVFRYTISNGTCTPNSEDVTVEIYQQPTPSVAGPNQQFCNENSTTLAGNIPDIGTGSWSVVSQPVAATVAFADETEANTEVSGITEPGTYVLRWTTINGTCTSYSDMRITRYEDLEITDPVGGETCENETYSMSVNASGGTGTYTYQWQYSADNSNWSNVTGGAGANARTYSTANDLSVGSHFFRALVSDCNTLTTQEATVIINEIPVVSATNTAQEFCDGETSVVMELSSNLPFSTYSWTRNSPAGITTTQPTSGTGDIPSAIIENSSTAPQTISYTIYANGPEPSECQSAPITATIIVNPTPMVNSASAITICNESSVDYTITSATTGTTYTWSRDAVAGISNAAVTGQTGNPITEELTNETTAPIVVRYLISPTGPTICAGEDFDLVVTVNPTPNVSADNETICSSNSTDITLSSTVSGTTFYYAAPTISGEAGNITGGTARTSPGSAANITDNLVNTTAVDQTATYTVYPIFEGCVGTPLEVLVTVEPEPRVANQTLTVCSNEALAFTLPAGTGVAATSFNITAINQNGLTASAGNPATGNGLLANEIEDDAYTNATTAPVNVIYTVVPVADNGCVGAEFTVTATINPEPQVSDVGNALFCNSDQVTIDFGTQNSGGTTTYTWTNSNSDIGLAAIGTGNLDFTATNPGTAAITASIEVTPTFTNNGVACTGNSKSFTITVNPSAQINAIDDQELCNNSATTPVTFETTRTDGTTTYTWTNTNPAIGLAASGSGATIPSFTATNNTHNPISGSIAVTPTYTKDDESCSGEAETFTIAVNPTPIVSSVSMVTVCSASELEYIPTSFTTGTTFEWTASNTVGTVTGFTESGTGPISDVLTNAGSAEGEILYLITPTGPEPTNCVGLPFSLRVTVSNCEPAIGVAKQLVNTVYNEDGTLTAKYNIRVQNYGNTQLYDVQVTEDLTDAFGAGNYEVVQLFSTSFDVNTSFNGNSNTDLLDNGGTSNILEVGASTNIELQVKILSPGSYNNSVEVNAESISGPLSDLSQNGSDPDPDDDGNPGNNDAPTPVDFGACSITASVITNTNCGNAAGSVLLTGNEAGTVSLNGTEQASPATYSNLQAGWYTATFKATATGCISKASFEITNINSDLTGRVTLHEDVTCNGFDNGRITVTAFDGTAPYTYKVNGVEQPSNTFSDLAPGEYGCQITDANGCTYTVSFDIDEPTLLISQIMASEDESCFGAADGSATVVATGGTTPYTYAWSNGQTTATATGLAQGVYSVIVTDANGCETSASVTISGATQALAISGTATNLNCYNDNSGSIDITVSGGTAPYRYSWNNGFNAEDPSGLAAETYTVIVTDAMGCTTTESYTLTQPDALELLASGIENTTCNSTVGEVTLAEASGTAGTFTVNGNTQTGTSVTFDNLPAGFYTATFTATATGCTAETTFNIINTNSDLIANVDVADALCNGGTVTAIISVTGGTAPYRYSLNGETAQNSGEFDNLAQGSYNVLVTDANGCTYTVSFDIDEPTLLISQIIASENESCFGAADGSATIVATGGTTPYTYVWSNGQTAATATGLAQGVYSVIVTDANECETSASVTISGAEQILAISTPVLTNPVCFGSADGSINITVSGGTAPYSYVWSNGQASQNANGLVAGNYSVTVSDANGCSVSSETYTLTNPDEIILSAPVVTDANCDSFEDGEVQLVVASGGTAPFTFALSTGEINTSGAFDALATGGYIYTVTDANGCSASGAFEVDDPNELILTITDIVDVSCNAGSDGSFTVIATGGTEPYSYQLGNETAQPSATFNDLPAGVYLVTVRDENGCSRIQTIKITEPTELGIVLVDQVNPDCNDSGRIMLSGTGGTTPYVFTSSAGTVSGNAVSGLSAGEVTITITDKNNCTETLVVTLVEEDTAAPTFTCPETQTLFADDNCQVTVPDLTALVVDAADNCSEGDLTVTQSVAAGSVISSDLTVTVTVTDEDGNASSCDVLLVVEDTTPPVAICKDISRQLDMTGTVHISPQDVNAGSSDNCGLASMELDITTFTCDDLGENTVVLTITDDAGNISTCEAIVTIEDNIAPIVDCPAPVSLTADANCEAIVPDFVSDLNVSNNCANVTATQSPETGTTINTGVTTVTISVTDGVNTSTCTTSVTVVDQTAPTFTCPETQTIVADINCQGTLPDLTALITDANDDCTDDVIITQSIPAGTIINNDMVVTLKVTDEAGNVAECEVLVQIDYPERPTVSAGSNAEICSTTESYALSGTAVDADRVEWSTSGTGTFDDATSLEAIYTPSKADLFDGQIQLTLTAFGSGRCGIAKDNMVLTLWPQATAYAGRDANISPNSNYEIYDARASNYDSFTWTLLGDGTLQDTQTLTPVFVPNPNQTGTVSLVLSVEPYSDVCEAVTDTMTITIGESPSINFTKRTVNTLINADGTVEVTFELSLENTGNVLLSSLSLSDNLANAFTGTCSFSVITRLSENLNLNYNYDGVDDTELLEANNTLLVGIKKSVLLTVRVQNCDPLVTTYTNEAIARATSPGGTVVNGSDTSEILLSDNPSIGLAKQLVNLVLNSDGSYSALFNFRVSNYGDVDLSNVAVYDNLDAVFGAGNFEIEEIYSENFAVNTSFAGTLNDNMLDENTKLEVGRSGAVLLKVKILTAGSYVNTATATGNNPGGDLFTDSSHNGSDAAPGGGNNPNDFSDPTEINASDCTVEVICPTTATFTFNNTPGLCGYTIPDNGLDASGSASCTAVDVSHDYGAWGNRHSLKGATFPVGTTDVTWTAKDEIGNSVSCTVTITVRDREAPEFVNCPSGTTFTIGLFPGACEGGAIWSIPVARDNCSDVTVVQTRGPKQGDVLSPGTYPIEYRASDQAGNMTYCNFTIKVIDTEEPTIVCQPDLVKESDADNCSWTSTENSLSPLLANSNCPVEVIWEVTNPDGTTASGVNDVSGYVFELGTSTVKYFISEPGSSQSSSCSFRITVVDRHAPQIDCQDDLNIVAEAGECSATVALVPPVFTDNCSQAPASVSYYIYNPDNTVTSGTELTYEFQHGVSRIEWTTYDEAGNPGFCFQNVWVDADEESIKPDAGPDAIICESDSFRLSEATAPENVLVQWTTNGTGRFIDPTVVNAMYVPSQSDIANGFAVLTIKTSTDCASQSDHMILSIFKSPVVSAGNDAVICETDGYQLTGVSSNGTYGVEWITLGSGTFSNKNISSPVYTPGQSDIEAGEVQLVFRGIAAGSCSDALDTLTLNIDRQPLVNAGSDGWICEDETFVVSDAAAMFAESTFWTSSGTGTFDDPSLLNAGYTPSRADIINGSVMLTISSNPTGPCSAVSDKLLLTISARPVADAGGDLATCAGESIVISNAKASNFTSIHWSSSGTGVLENAATMNPTYVPGENESGTITLQMEVIGNNACGNDTIYDAIQLRIYDQIIVDAGPDQTVFFNKPAKLSVEVENGSGAYFYSWQPTGLVLDENARTTGTVNLTSTTIFEVTVTDGKSGCWAMDRITVNVEEDQDKFLNIFNAFSPNGDGVNDNWIIEGIENFPDNKVKIFNRWGDQIIALDRYDNVNSVWDGRNAKGNLVPDGTYFYIVEITGLKSYTGWVHIRSEQ